MKKCRFFVSLLAMMLSIGIILSACGKQTSGQQDSNTGITSKEEQTKEEIVLTFPHWYFSHGGSFDRWAYEAIDEFMEKNPGIKIDGFPVAYEEYWAKMDIAIAAGTSNDIMAFGSNVGKYILNGHLLPLNDYIDMEDFKNNFNDIQNVNIPQFAPDGKTYIVANVSAYYMPIYRPSVLKKAGWEEFPKSYEEFFKMLGDLKNIGVTPYAMMTNPGNFNEQFIDIGIWIISQGGHWTKDNKPNLDSKEVIQAYKMIKELYDAGYIIKDTDKGTYRQMFGSGDVGVLIDGPWVYGQAYTVDPTVEGDFAVAPIFFTNGKYSAGWEGFSASSKTKYPEICGKLITFLTSKEQMQKFMEIVTIIPPRTDLFDDAAFKNRILNKYPWMGVFVENAANVVDNYPHGIPAERNEEFRKIAGTALERILYENAEIESTLKQAQEEAMKLLN
ncbi:MAG TPA: extracellular solute-binding protein [Clostridiaceae bacterium]|nr:extracellular solute-binding protein [Clostridiaceae bacterium]